MSHTEYESLIDYLEAEEADLLTEVRQSDVTLEKGSHNQKSRKVGSILTKSEDQLIIKTPQQASEMLEADVDVVVHMGCHSIQTPHIVEGTVDVLEALGYTTVPLGGFNNCCGILDFQNGDFDMAERVDNNRFSNIEAFEPDYAITECTSCFATSDKLSMGYRETDGYEFISMIEFLYNRREQLEQMTVETEEVTVVLHDHYDAYEWTPPEEAKYARFLLEALPGVEIVEMDHSMEDPLPCNFQTDRSKWGYDDLTEQVYREAAEAGADLLINFWHACHRNMVVYDPHFPVETRNYTNFIGERLGFEYRDKIKEYKLAGRDGDIEWVIKDAQPALEANGISETEARQIIKEYLIPQSYVGC